MTVYDSHCHVFNVGILKGLVAPVPSKGLGGVVSDWWSWLSELLCGAFGSERSNNRIVLGSLEWHFPGQSYATVPLMMDICYAKAPTLMPGRRLEPGPFSLRGLRSQTHALKRLSAGGGCYPFFAVDPRRPGIVEAIIDGQLVTRTPGGFYGVKLYPRMGYHPMSGRLPELYAHCAANGIPIVTHCSPSGFWSSDNADLCDPENFRPALAANPSLRINFAHWGHGNLKWGSTILDLMARHPGVYSDLSCYTHKYDLPRFKSAFWGKPFVADRTMYGSDYNMIYLTHGGMNIEDYVGLFSANFSKDELVAMASSVPEGFLGLSASR